MRNKSVVQLIIMIIAIFIFMLPGWQKVLYGQQIEGESTADTTNIHNIKNIYDDYLGSFEIPDIDTAQLSISQAIGEAMQNNERLKSSRMMIEAAHAAVSERDAYYKPHVEANFQYSYLDIVPGFKRERLGNIEHTLFPYISAKQVIYSGGRLNNKKEFAEIAKQKEKTGLDNEITNIKLAINANYYRLISAINQKNIILENLKHLENQERYTRLMIRAGRISKLEIYRISVERNALKGMLLKQDSDIAELSQELCALMGRDEFEIIIPSDSLQILPLNVEYQNLVNTAKENNPSWQELELDIMQHEAKVKIRQSEKMPYVSAQVWAGYEFGPEQFSFIDNRRYFAGLTASMPIYDGGINNAQIHQAQAELESTQWNREYYLKSLRSELENLYRRLEEMQNQFIIQTQRVDENRQSYRLAILEYQAGSRSNTDLLDIQQSLVKSEFQLNDAKVEYNIVKTKILYVLGIL